MSWPVSFEPRKVPAQVVTPALQIMAGTNVIVSFAIGCSVVSLRQRNQTLSERCFRGGSPSKSVALEAHALSIIPTVHDAPIHVT